MGSFLLSLMTVLLFCISARFFAKSLIVSPFDFRNHEYSVRALRVERYYKMFAWGLLALFLFASFVISFFQSFMAVIG